MKSALMCQHANEVPVVCKCKWDCYCKSHTCKSQSNKLSEAFDAAGIPSTVYYFTDAQLKEHRKMDRAFNKWLKDEERRRKAMEKWLKKHPIVFK